LVYKRDQQAVNDQDNQRGQERIKDELKKRVLHELQVECQRVEQGIVRDELDKRRRSGQKHENQYQNEPHEEVKQNIEILFLLAVAPVDIEGVYEEPDVKSRNF